MLGLRFNARIAHRCLAQQFKPMRSVRVRFNCTTQGSRRNDQPVKTPPPLPWYHGIDISTPLFAAAAGFLGVALVPRVARVAIVAGPLFWCGASVGAVAMLVRFAKMRVVHAMSLVSIFPVGAALWVLKRDRDHDSMLAAQTVALEQIDRHFGSQVTLIVDHASMVGTVSPINGRIRWEFPIDGVVYRGRRRTATVELCALQHSPFSGWMVESIKVSLQSNNMVIYEAHAPIDPSSRLCPADRLVTE